MRRMFILFFVLIFILTFGGICFSQTNEESKEKTAPITETLPVPAQGQPAQAAATVTAETPKQEAQPAQPSPQIPPAPAQVEPAQPITQPQTEQPKPMTPVEPLDFKMLIEILPKTPEGWKDTEAFGEKVNVEAHAYSFASKEYIIDENRNVEVQITDYAYIESLYKPFKESQSSTYEGQTEYLKAIDIKGNPGVESYDRDAKYGEILILVNNRFMIQISGYNVESTKPLFDILATIDLEKLSQLK